MPGRFTNIKAQVVSILQANVSATVYDYAISTVAGISYPLITVTAKTGSGTHLTNVHNERHYIITIRCMQERLVVGEQAAETTLTALVDQVITVFDQNPQLNNAATYAMPAPSQWGYIKAPDIEVRTADVDLDVMVAEPS